MLFALTEQETKLIFQEWGVVCEMSRVDPEKSSIIRRKADGQWFLMIVWAEKKR